jgi:sialic acid synthase SpsE
MKIIAECGVNFDTVDQVFAMIGKSKEAGCAYTKFQLYDESVIKDSPLQAELQKRMITREFAELLVEEGEADRQPVFFTPMFLEAVDWVAEIGVPMIKIRYADRYNFKLVEKALDVGVPVLISADHRYLNYCRDPRVKLLYCIPKYPAAPEDYQIIPEDFSTGAHTCAPVFAGVSDHTKRLEVMRRAQECGAEFCEVHVMHEWTHPIDEAVSKEFEEVKAWVEQS